jgi:hypothetical protein
MDIRGLIGAGLGDMLMRKCVCSAFVMRKCVCSAFVLPLFCLCMHVDVSLGAAA